MLSPIFQRASGRAIAAGKRRTGQLLLTASFTLLLGHAATAQNAPTPASIPIGDRVLYGRHGSYAKKTQAPQHAPGDYLSPRELRLKRHQYVTQHRDGFPAIYQPGVE
jgi:hypothetical protein